MKPKQYVIRFRAINRETFNLIKKGKKRIETRAATVRYTPIKKGDEFVLVCGKEKFTKEVRKVSHFKSIDALLKKYTYEQIHPGIGGVKELKEMYASFPGYIKKIRKSGILAFELK